MRFLEKTYPHKWPFKISLELKSLDNSITEEL